MKRLLDRRVIKCREAQAILQKLGFRMIGAKGTHQRWERNGISECFILVYKDDDLTAIAYTKMKQYLRRHNLLEK